MTIRGWLYAEQWRDVSAPLRLPRSPELLRAIVAQFDVENATRYRATPKDTFCNIFVFDVMRAIVPGELPRVVDANTGEAVSLQSRDKVELRANDLVAWLDRHGARFGWSEMKRERAIQEADEGRPTIVCSVNQSGPGHVAVLMPGGGIAQAGSFNSNFCSIEKGFGARAVRFFGHR